MLSPKQIGTICFAIFSFVFSAPSFADPDIAPSASTADCKYAPLETYTGTSNLQADWQPNTIALHWYNGDTEITSGVQTSCVYDGALTPPTTIPTKTGYTFKGWRVRSCFADSVCGLEGGDISGLTISAFGFKSNNGQLANNTTTYGLTENGTWAVEFSDGSIVKGIAVCNNNIPTVWDTAMDSEDALNMVWGNCSSDALKPGTTFGGNSTGSSCWCKITSFTPNGDSACNVTTALWVNLGDLGSDTMCLGDNTSACAGGCALDFDESTIRHAMFGVSQ